jgi:hypothetical protein
LVPRWISTSNGFIATDPTSSSAVTSPLSSTM